MKIILLNDVPKIGSKNEVKDVASGYARNFLLRRGFARIATDAALLSLEKETSLYEASNKKILEGLEKMLSDIDGTKIEITVRANQKGKLFSGITREMIAQKLQESGHDLITLENINLDAPIKDTGEYIIRLNTPNKKAQFTLQVVAESKS
jgi:large subunit ribosomal protein L9